MKLHFELLNADEIQKVHEASLEVLSKTGMRLDSEQLLNGLRKRGAKVDESKMIARFPESIIENALENNRKMIQSGKKLHLLNGVTSELSKNGKIEAKMSGGCNQFFDWKTQSAKKANAHELLNHIRLGEKIPEVSFVGNTIIINNDLDGREIDNKMKRIRTAAFIAKNTTKLGSIEVWSTGELDFLVDMGIVARGGKEKYYEKPCFVTAKETISPLHLDKNSGDILIELAKRNLPCSIIPMPITGVSSPITKLGNIIVGNAEILGVIAAVRSVCPDAVVGGGSITGILDMQTSVVSFSAPEAILQDIAIAEVHEKLYGFDYLIGSGYFDAKYPNAQVLTEKSLKFLLTYLSGRYTYPVGLINSGAAFSLEQALVDIEICRYIHGHFASFSNFDSINEIVDLINKIGIRGHYISEDHTLHHFKENWFPKLFDRTSFTSFEDSRSKDIYNQAHEKINKLLSSGDFWEIDKERAKEIDKIVALAEKTL